jgi:CRISPR type III-associated protein (TIGR04423 family)
MNNKLYDGYLWYSDQKTPEVFEQKAWDESMLDENVNPFVIEGQLYDSENLVSYSIKYVDGKYIIKKYQLKSTDFNNVDVDIDILDFKAHRMGEGRVLQFLQYYREEEDSLCEGMKVLQPAEKVFVGFKK